ncbi:MAG: GNAT family N-acetyltransferase [Verrucomicrobiota bacterium]
MDPASFHPDDFEKETEGECIRVALDSTNGPIGFLSAWLPESFIHHLWVDPRFLRRGVGSILLEDGLQQLGRPAQLKCGARNLRARDFYRSQGWRIINSAIGAHGLYHLMAYGPEQTTTANDPRQ